MFQSLRTNELFDDYVVFDIETSGLNPHKDKIIEIGAIKYINNKKVDEFSYLIDPEINLTNIITIVTGLTDEDLKGQKVVFKVNGKTVPIITEFVDEIYTTKNITKGIAQWNYTIPNSMNPGKYEILISYNGNTQSNPIKYGQNVLTIK